MKRIPLKPGEFYHLYNRGVDKRIIFSEPSDYKRFLAYLFILNTQEKIRPSDLLSAHGDEKIYEVPRGKQIIAIGAYCLMPNHFHIYATPLIPDGMSKFMQRLQTAYTMYFNQKRHRIGALFEGVFKAQHVDSDIYARHLFSFIHLNPIAMTDPDWKQMSASELSRYKKEIAQYPYSSIGEYLECRHVVTDPSKFPKYFSGRRHVDDHISMWLRAREMDK